MKEQPRTYFTQFRNSTVNSLINGHANHRTALINGRIHFPWRIADQTLIDNALKSGQAVSGLSF